MPDHAPALRVILLGASNLQSALPLVLDLVRRRAGGPAEVLAACGHGRSYGSWSRFLYVRHLPGIADCGLWRALAGRPSLPTLALVTDVGNDLAYGAGPGTAARWVETCLDRLAGLEAETVLTLLPLARLERLSPWGVRLALSLLYSGRNAPWPGLLEEARELNGRLREMGLKRGARLVEPRASWYGIDPIHVLRRRRREVWESILGLEDRADLPSPSGEGPGVRSHGQAGWIPLLGAAEWRLAGRTVRTAQPVARLADGTTVSLY